MASNRNPATQPQQDTWFAPAERAPEPQLRAMVDYCLRSPITRVILESVDGYVLVLNSQRQIVAANPETLRALKINDSETILGLRPGEAFYCIHGNDEPGGCGTSKSCATCGAAIAIMACQDINQPATGECLMTVQRDGRIEAHEFSVRATPLKLDGDTLTVFVLHDINAEKRREALEMVFLHDLSNVITGLMGWSKLLLRNPRDVTEIARNIVSLSEHMTQEIQYQRMILQAEQGNLAVSSGPVSASEILEGVRSFFACHINDACHRLEIETADKDMILNTCQALATRIIVNMVKNALEATSATERVRTWYELRGGRPCFVAHNPGKIPDRVAPQIFKRSFSTKGKPGRGLGAYSMKLFGEQVLGGTVDFTTSDEEGTCFFFMLPSEAIVQRAI